MSAKDYSSEYQRKLMTAQAAAGLVQSNMTIHFGGAGNLAVIIDKYLAQRKDELQNVRIQTFLDTQAYEFLQADMKGEVFKWYSSFVLPASRNLANMRGLGLYTPTTWHLAPGIIRKQYSYDIAYLVTAPMDAHGYFNFGLMTADFKAIAEKAKKVVLLVRDDMPHIYGGLEESIHISEVAQIVKDDEFETFCLPQVTVKPEDRMIAENIVSAGLIKDGSTLQIGIGGLPNSVLDALPDAGIKHCGLHTEMCTEKMVDLIETGVVDNTRKRLDRFKTVCSFGLGSRKLYDYLHKNPSVAFYPVNYVNNPSVIAQQPDMFSLNSAMQVDLTGQVASEQIGGARPRQISGTGGQLDFVMGTMLSQDGAGVSVLGLYSQHKEKTSRIVPMLSEGTAVTVPRTIVDHIATEWGLVRLRGLAIDERVQALIRIAHPVHREDLMRQASELGLLPYGAAVENGRLPKGVLNCRD